MCDRCAVVRCECVAKGLGVGASVGNKVWKVALESGVVQSAMYGLSHGPRRAGSGQWAAGGGQRAGGMRDCGFVEFSAGGRLQLRAGSVETDGRLRRRRIETELICWWSVESVKRCEAWEEMKEEKSDSPVDEGATRTGTLFLVACVRVPCARLPELTNEKKLEMGAGQETGAERARAKCNLRNARRGPILPPSQHGG